ncbi:Predicted dehydrogenase [Thermomonospora echinospora]|uniref:Predicted dehydrogenase n=1 Tax=Thermomonospora echinospora TaxID=1992 RepID=A0A1H6DMA2_9ACTN|nr:Gfo/Idh/MocA family oxidoreductase [Thermomonospora echinospora]SEG86527.1 Predicted dehydrogenase [Thermomonospora echinospora]
MLVPSVGCAVVGCGDVSTKYLRTLRAAPIIDIVACCDVLPERARRLAARCARAVSASLPEILADPAVELVINLTPPQQHTEITLRALRAGKSVYTEKPVATSPEELAEVLVMAGNGDAMLGGAPDTALGPAAQAARRAIDEGRIGRPLGASAALLTPGHERSCPTPEVFYRKGAGPLLDMGVYYLTMLVSLLGPVREVVGAHSRPSPLRVIDTGPRARTSFATEVPTHVAALLVFENREIVTLTASFEVWGTRVPHLEIFGTEGTLSIPDPNFYTGAVRLKAARSREWIPLPYPPDAPVGRGIGVIDMAHALRGLTGQRLTGGIIGHVVETMLAVEAEKTAATTLASRCDRPAPLRSAPSPTGCWWCEQCGDE